MIGKRIEDGAYPENPGEYSRHIVNDVVCWLIVVPTGGHAFYIGKPNSDNSVYHWVEEHEDETITVQPNPSDAPPERQNSNSILYNNWHGYIYHGQWKEI